MSWSDITIDRIGDLINTVRQDAPLSPRPWDKLSSSEKDYLRDVARDIEEIVEDDA